MPAKKHRCSTEEMFAVPDIEASLVDPSLHTWTGRQGVEL